MALLARGWIFVMGFSFLWCRRRQPAPRSRQPPARIRHGPPTRRRSGGRSPPAGL